LGEWEGALSDVARALAINPADPPTLRRAGILFASLGRFEEAIVHLRKSVETDPLLATSWNWLGVVQSAVGRLDEARAAMERALEIAPGANDVRANLVGLFLLRGDTAGALGASRALPDEEDRLWFAAVAEHELGHFVEAQRALDDLVRKVGDVRPMVIADLFAERGDKDQAFEWLERSFLLPDNGLHQIKIDLFLRKLHDDPRYTTFLKKMNLPLD
jgi:adenylate cyclase